MLDNIDIRKWIIAGLLILHIAWIGNHVRWVAAGQINPWRLGGYAMYTVPSPSPGMQVYDVNFPETRLKASTVRYDAATRFTNASRTFRCANVPSAALLAFFDENKDLIGRNLAFVFTERQFFRNPPTTKRTKQGFVTVMWRNERTFTYTNRFCGKEESASATLPESTLPEITPALP
jgi:hypothetical protein